MHLIQFPNICKSGQACAVCRGTSKAAKAWQAEHNAPVECLFPPTVKPLTVVKQNADIREPAEITPSNIVKLLTEWSSGELVDDATTDARRAKCATCTHKASSPAGDYCGHKKGCGCTLGARKLAFVTIGWADITRWKQKEKGKKLCPLTGKPEGWEK